jgi:NTP pyrophosphatase (non-canonical NTP hydrolase)
MGYPYQGIEPDEYQQAALRTERTPNFISTHSAAGHDEMLGRLLHAALGACTETGELQDMIKKHLIYDRPLDKVNVLEECGDAIWYLSLALSACGYTMSECMERNLDKLRKRFPDKFTTERANERDLDAERAALEGK